MALDSMKEIFDQMERENIPFWEVVLQADMEERQVTRKQSMAKMLITWQAMEDAADTYTGTRKSVSGLVGGDGIKMRQYAMRGAAMSGGYVCDVIAEALSMAESNACMRRIVAAPTAGACGVLPAVLLPLCNYEELTQHQLLEALYVASGIGAVIAHRACISGAAGGCQAEIGTAAAMAAVFTADIQEYMSRQHNVKVSERMAERIKINAGAALTELGEDAPEDYIVHGPNRITALPMEVPVCYQEVAHCLEKSISKIETAILNALENTPPELYADIVHNGIYLAGGGALLRGLDKRLTDKINIPFHIAEDPLHAVAKGTGVALKNVDRFSFLMR